MSALKSIALFLIGAALVAALWIGGQSLARRPAEDIGTARRNGSPPSQAQVMKPPPVEAGKDTVGEPQRVRRIAPDSIAGPDISGPLKRIAPREPLTAATKPLKREAFGPPVPSGTLLYQPVAKAAGEIEADGHIVRLAGIKITPADRTCSDDNRHSWPCGAVARTAFRAWVRRRAVACDVPSHPGEIITHCTLDGEDMALWLVRNGWAKSAGQYDDAEAEARREKKGVFGPSPLGTGEE